MHFFQKELLLMSLLCLCTYCYKCKCPHFSSRSCEKDENLMQSWLHKQDWWQGLGLVQLLVKVFTGPLLTLTFTLFLSLFLRSLFFTHFGDTQEAGSWNVICPHILESLDYFSFGSKTYLDFFGMTIFFAWIFKFGWTKVACQNWFPGSGPNQKGHLVLVFVFLCFRMKTDNTTSSDISWGVTI